MVRPKKHLGQHFLTDLRVAERTAGLVNQSEIPVVLEIGPGKGVLTRFLLQQPGKRVYAIEVDHESVEYLEREGILDSSCLEEADFLESDLTFLPDGEFILIGNYPYNISTQILFKMIGLRHRIPLMAGMFQKEVAVRVAARPGNKDYGITSVITQAYYEVKLEFKIPPGAFFPPPKVDSAVISCQRRPVSMVPAGLDKLFTDVVKTAFNQRRKTLSNSLSKFNISSSFIQHPFAKLRPETLTVEEFAELTSFIEKTKKIQG